MNLEDFFHPKGQRILKTVHSYRNFRITRICEKKIGFFFTFSIFSFNLLNRNIKVLELSLKRK